MARVLGVRSKDPAGVGVLFILSIYDEYPSSYRSNKPQTCG